MDHAASQETDSMLSRPAMDAGPRSVTQSQSRPRCPRNFLPYTASHRRTGGAQ